MVVYRLRYVWYSYSYYTVHVLTSHCKVVECRKSFLDWRRYRSHRHDVGKVQVADDSSTHQTAPIAVSSQVWNRHNAHGIWPRYLGILLLPPDYDEPHVEPEYKCQIDSVLIHLAVSHSFVEWPEQALSTTVLSLTSPTVTWLRS